MKKMIDAIHRIFFNPNQDLKVRIFHAFTMVGSFICIATASFAAFTQMYVAMVVDLVTFFFSVGLLFFSVKSGRYELAYTLTIVTVFLFIFPIMFLTTGGYQSGAVFFFVFAIVFTIFMLDGWRMVLVSGIELLVYCGIIVFAYLYPESVHVFMSPDSALFNLMMSFLTVSCALAATLYFQLHLYQKQQKELEHARQEAEAANLAKSAFLASMSHEIRTPIHIILGMNEIIARESDDQNIRKCTERISTAGKTLMNMVDSVLVFSKLESGKLQLQSDAYYTRNLLDTLNLIGNTRCEKKGLIFQLNAENLPPVLWGDFARIEQIAGNLLGNAIKYTEKGTVTVTVKTEATDREDERLLSVTVQDTGIGIAKEDLPTLFTAFTRVESKESRGIEGTGLGLVIVKDLTEMMNGRIQVESSPGKGSTFSVILPQKYVPEAQDSQELEKTFLAPKARVLFVDDNPGNLAIFTALFSDTQIQLDTAESGAACLDMVQHHTYHMILMDYMMPGMDGLETFRRLRALPGFHVPTVALTADTGDETRKKLLEAGFSEVASKPAPWKAMHKILLTYLPKELVTIIPLEKRIREEGISKELTEKLLTYGISIDRALNFFYGDLKQCLATAALFLKYDDEEQRKAKELAEKGDLTSLRFLVHTLKAKANGMGIKRLYDVAYNMEALCAEGKKEEASSLAPYLFYLWEQAAKGMTLLVESSGIRPASDEKHTLLSAEECKARLPELLSRLQRRPSLECLHSLMAQEQNAALRRLLNEVKDSVAAFDFEQAERLFSDYLSGKGANA